MKNIIVIVLMILGSNQLNAKMLPFTELYQKYGELVGEPIVGKNKKGALLTFKKMINEVPKYTLIYFNGETTTVINPPLEPRPFGAEIASKTSGKPLQELEQLEYFGTSFKVNNRYFIGYGLKNITRSKTPENGNYFLYEYVGGELKFNRGANQYMMAYIDLVNFDFEKYKKKLFSEFAGMSDSLKEVQLKPTLEAMKMVDKSPEMKKLKSNPEMISLARAKEKENEIEQFGTFGEILFNSNDAAIVEANINNRSAYYFFDGNSFTYFAKSPDRYTVTSPSIKKLTEEDYIYTVQCGRKLFSIEHEVQRKIASFGGHEYSVIVEHRLKMFDLETKKKTFVDHDHFYLGDKDIYREFGTGKDRVYDNELTARQNIYRKAQMMLRVVNGEIYYARNTYIHDNNQHEVFRYSEKNKKLVYDARVSGTRESHPGCMTYFNGQYFYSTHTTLTLDGEPNNFFNPYTVATKKWEYDNDKAVVKGHWANLDLAQEPWKFGDKIILQYFDLNEMNALVAFDGSKFYKFTGFETRWTEEKNGGVHTINRSPKNYFSVNGKSYVAFPVEKKPDDEGFYFGLCEWTYDSNEIIEIKQHYDY